MYGCFDEPRLADQRDLREQFLRKSNFSFLKDGPNIGLSRTRLKMAKDEKTSSRIILLAGTRLASRRRMVLVCIKGIR